MTKKNCFLFDAIRDVKFTAFTNSIMQKNTTVQKRKRISKTISRFAINFLFIMLHMSTLLLLAA